MNKSQLVAAAREAKNNAYAPYSQFPVGAALLLDDNTVITGVNVENVSFGATNCAERTALFTAIAKGYKKGQFKAIAVVGETESFLPPCCICRQVLIELCDSDMPVYLSRNDGAIQEYPLSELVPLSFEQLDM